VKVGDTVTVRTIHGRDNAATVVEVHDEDTLTVRIGELNPLPRLSRAADPANPTPFTWRPA